MDTSIQNIWKCWYLFRSGKEKTLEFYKFEYGLERNLSQLHRELLSDTYRHGSYCRFTVYENKKRDIVVAPLRDRVVHRMLYEYLVPIFDKTFIYDVWSCRKGKGLLGAIERTQDYANQYPNGYVWRTDIKKFFDSVNHEALVKCIERRVTDPFTLKIIKDIIAGYTTTGENSLGKVLGLGVKRSGGGGDFGHWNSDRKFDQSDIFQHLSERTGSVRHPHS